MSKKGKGYLDLGWVISLILLIPGLCIIGWIFAIVERYKRGNILGMILTCFFFCFGILWICDIVTLILDKDIKVLA